ncbi:DUF4097 family beta strand repeat-containing protein [Streptomyces sp. NPDC053427]|uniref:DUF4097 family beta strand repeat-containing protein n=1 Tax=Streptomyces sp. NPDC053427 TaxID=3365701 RepID=UPI0037D5823E
MPEFDTPDPISATLEFDIGTVRITAGKRTQTVVEVLPRSSTEEADVRTVQQTQVTYSNGKLLVKGPRKRSLFGTPGALEVSIELPAGSDVRGSSPLGNFVCEGPLGDCRIKTSVGDIQVDEADTVSLKTSHGDILLDHAKGNAEVVGAGRVDIGKLAGAASVGNVNGETTIAEVAGELRASSSNGPISVGVAHAGVEAKSANGGIRIGEVARGRVTLQSAAGNLEVGIREATAAWLDVNTRLGNVRNSLGASEGPAQSDETVEVRARTGLGDIVIRRS